jgi:cell division protein FtsN
VEEKVVPVDPRGSANHNYYVIIGSFRDPVNAREYQGEISAKGFTPAILRNEAGLYRVSVLSTNDIETARDDIRRIRRDFPEHADTWLLIQKNQN